MTSFPIALLLLLASCAPMTVQTIPGYCVPESIYSAWTWEAKTGNPARIAISNIKPGIDHAQAQGWTGKEWVYLTHHNGTVYVWPRHFSAEPYRFWGLDEWIADQRQYRRKP